MGIPAYFSYIVKNHVHILKRFSKYPIAVNHFYLDSNSIIYDVFYKSEGPITDWHDFATRICRQIETYIATILPTDSVLLLSMVSHHLRKSNNNARVDINHGFWHK